jgi:hypothetical protein
MKVKHKNVEVRVSRRILWVDDDAFPLALVTRVRPVEYRPNRRGMASTYSRRAGATIGIAIVGLMFLSCLGDAVSPALSIAFAMVMLAIFVTHTVRLIRGLTRSNLYVLSVSTAGSAHAAVISTNRDVVYELSTRVVDAIDNPSAEFEIRVDHIEIVHGDKVGRDKYGGDRVEGDKILEGWS